MATTVTGKLNKAATQFQAGDGIGFGVRLGVKFYNRTTKAEEYTNYSAVIFAKAPAQIEFYKQALVAGAVIEVSGDKCRIEQYQGQNGLSLSIEILDARLGAVFAPQQAAAPSNRPAATTPSPQPGYGQQAPQNGYNQSPQQAPQQYQHQPNPANFNASF